MPIKKCFFVDSFRFFAALAVFVFLAAISACLITLQEYFAAAVFFAAGSLFIPSALQYGKVVEIDENGVRLSLLGRTRLEIGWDATAEVGVAGNDVFCRNKKQRYETYYIYLSSSVMTDSELFDMMLKFPPRDKICFAYSHASFNALRRYWYGSIRSYNTGDKRFGES